jgi:hypothetical protein
MFLNQFCTRDIIICIIPFSLLLVSVCCVCVCVCFVRNFPQKEKIEIKKEYSSVLIFFLFFWEKNPNYLKNIF